MDNILKKCTERYLGGRDETVSINKLYGDASYRTYFRILFRSGDTLIAMKLPEGISSASEEITNYEGKPEKLPYIDISDYLGSAGVPVPKTLHYDKKEGVLLLEDLGDKLFFDFVDSAPEEERFDWYKRAIDLLVDIQEKTAKARSSLAFHRSFDGRLLNWEFDHFLEYGIGVRSSCEIPEDVKGEFNRLTREITREIEKLDYIFVHRDYQSRNIMVNNDKLYVIDFQDALLGPYCYDLVALLRDSYIELSDGLLQRLLAYYSEKRNLDITDFKRAFDLVTVQRKLKDAGRFVYIEKVKGNSSYLKYIPGSLEYVRKAAGNLKEFQSLYSILKPYIPEWNNE